MKEKAVEREKAKKQAAQKRDPGDRPVFRRLEEMNLLDDFLFGSVVTYPEVGERFVKSLLKVIFGKEFKHLSVTAQKVLYGADRNLHGTRLDVYLEPEAGDDPEGRVIVYDIEPDRKDTPADKKALPRRVRFYHGKIAARSLNSGVDYNELKDVVVIMILPSDPFGLKRMLYTVKNRCLEVPEMEYEDGASTLFLYTRGTEGVPSEELRQLLYYMEDTVYENAVNEELREIHRMVETVKKDSEVVGLRIQIVDDMIRLTEENARISEESAKKTERITELTEKNEKMAAKNVKMAEEIIRLRKELAQKA